MDFTVQAEARFLSHRDTMRLMAHATGRARIPVKYTEGFNPHPKLSLPLPRPVAVASRAERLVVKLTESADPDETIRRLSPQMPPGICFTGCKPRRYGQSPRACSATYSLAIRPMQAEPLGRRLMELAGQDHWPWPRSPHGAPEKRRELDLKELAGPLDFDGHTLVFTLTPQRQVWAAVSEVLELVGLGESDRARLVRTSVQWADDEQE